jgi:hypothetical protein
MAVKVRTKQLIQNKEVLLSTYLPQGSALGKEKREKADRLDARIKLMTDSINSEYGQIKSRFKGNVIGKWKWLGGELASSIEMLLDEKLLEQSDIDNNAIWAGFGQYMRPELNRGFHTKRSASEKDHYRKCWLLATVKGTEWIKSWVGWDAFVDRGYQLVNSHKVMPILNDKLKNISLSKSDYQNLAREITDELPSNSGAVTLSAMSDSDIQRIIDGVTKRVLGNKIIDSIK